MSGTPRRPLGAAVIATIGVAFTRPATSAIVTIGRPQCDAELLALRPRLEAAVAEVGATEMATLPAHASEEDEERMNDWVNAAGTELSAVCSAIISAPPAHTIDGRALKAAAAMHELCFSSCDGEWPSPGEEFAWRVLSEIAGPVYAPWDMPERLRVKQPGRA